MCGMKQSALITGSVCIGVSLLLSGCTSSMASSQPQAAPASTGISSGASAAVVLASPGRVEGRSETIQVGAATDGLIKSVYVQEGQTVTAGQLLAEIDCPELQANLRTATAEVESYQQVRARLLRGSREEERRSAEQRTAAAQAVVAQSEAELHRYEELFGSRVASQKDLDTARRDYDVAEARLREARKNEELVKAGPLTEELAKADADIQASEERKNAIEDRIGKCRVLAPINGTVLQTLMRRGESFSTLMPKPLFTIADLSVRRVRAEVDEHDVPKVRRGQQVLISSEGDQPQTFPGTVASVSRMMGRKKILTGNPSEKADRDVLEALVDFDATKTVEFPVGMRVVVQFLQ